MASSRKPTDFEQREAQRLAKLRREAGMSQAWLADQLGVSSQQWSKCERGENRIPLERFQMAERILSRTLGRDGSSGRGFAEAAQHRYASGDGADHMSEIIAGIRAAREALDQLERLVRGRLD